MSSYLSTTFVFKNTGAVNLHLSDAMVYADSNAWVSLKPDGAPPSYDCNVGIGWYSVSKPLFGPSETCTAEMRINAGVVNEVPFSSDKCSLLFRVNGSDVHLDIHANGGIAHKGIYGQDPKAVEWDCKLHKVGGANEFHLKGNPAG
jgi:hypothetical protein